MITSVLGHTTLAEAERCIEEADPAGLAEDAAIKLEGHKATGLPKPLPPVWEQHRKVKEIKVKADALARHSEQNRELLCS
jgi:hypothetical protein